MLLLNPTKLANKIYHHWSSKMAQHVRTLVVKTNNLSWIPGTLIVGES